MSSTQILAETLAKALEKADPNRLADILRIYGLGTHLSPQKYSWLGATGASAVNIASALFLSQVTPGPFTPTMPPGVTGLPPALLVSMLRVFTGASGVVGQYMMTDPAGSLAYPAASGGASGGVAPGFARLSDDGTTITFPQTVSGFVIEYVPRSFLDVMQLFEHL